MSSKTFACTGKGLAFCLYRKLSKVALYLSRRTRLGRNAAF
ncbi:hypothetical protein B4099_0324 [Heyndrickxia coagulans]|uniref:Uncharacterized protein n=1 Tax=Heyndrickxia coagulans TaxID=1398 RepID=A0A150KF18_HEYCO|nr:hypothetical protein B4099_0324 [Heyndrickxia coagulans]